MIKYLNYDLELKFLNYFYWLMVTCTTETNRKPYIYYLLACMLIFGIQSKQVFAQPCNCPAYESQKNVKTKNKNDEKIFLAELENSKNPICQAKRFEWMVQDMLEHSKRIQNEFIESSLQKTYQIYADNKCPEESYLKYYMLLSLYYHNQSKYEQSVEICLKYLPIAEANNRYYEQAVCYTVLSSNFNRTKQSAKGLEFAQHAVKLLENIQNPWEKADVLAKISSRYLWRFQDTQDATLLDSSFLFCTQQLIIAKRLKDTSILITAYNRLNGIAYEKHQYPIALKYIDSCIQLFRDGADNSMKATTFGDKADILMELKNFTEAKKYADSCLHYHKLDNYPEYICNAYALLYQVNLAAENYKEAIDDMNHYHDIHDSLTALSRTKSISELELKYNKVKDEKTILELAQEKRIYLLISISALLGIFAIVFFFRQQSLKNKQTILETEQRLNRARMNPHFFFNALSSLQTFALQHNDGKAVAISISKFAHIMRETLESTYKEYVTIDQEITFLTEYMELQKMRFPQKYSYDIDFSNEIEPDEMIIPSMILQPFIENIIEHGFTSIDYPGNISIHFSTADKNIYIRIQDNGTGLDSHTKEKGKHISRASQIIQDRIYLLNQKLKTNANFTIENNTSEKGVIVQISLPLLFKDEINQI